MGSEMCIRDRTNCNGEEKVGNVVNWDAAEWTLMDLYVEEIDIREICHPLGSMMITLSTPRDFGSTLDVCQELLGGSLATANSPDTAKEMIQLIEKEGKKTCPTQHLGIVFAGYTDDLEEGTFIDNSTGKIAEWTNWMKGELMSLTCYFFPRLLAVHGQPYESPCQP